jgi:nicotinate phosphoribosyltransferase
MGHLSQIYGHSLTLLTDLYQLTMAYGYWKSGMHDTDAVFHLYHRKSPFQGGYAVAGGLETAVDFINGFRFTDTDLSYLKDLPGNDGNPLFEKKFLDYLASLRLSCSIHSIPEGTVVFPHEPLVRVQGPLLHCQLLETPLLNIINFETLIATKASRICSVVGGDPVLEFGLRRAQGIDGGLTAARAAYIGGCAATSNVLAGKLFGIPVRGTHAHSWVMSFDTEMESFQAYAEAMPNNCVFLVDTYDTLAGVRLAIQTGLALRKKGHEMVGIRLDSGDLADLSLSAREMLDRAGFKQAIIIASNDLDEYMIQKLKNQGATINVWGVGTKLTTGYDQPALDGVYKLSAVRSKSGQWRHRLKLSEEKTKTSNPGILQVRRFHDTPCFLCDMIYDELNPPSRSSRMVDLHDTRHITVLPETQPYDDLLIQVYDRGRMVYRLPKLADIRDRAKAQLDRLSGETKAFQAHRPYPVRLEKTLHEIKNDLIKMKQSPA